MGGRDGTLVLLLSFVAAAPTPSPQGPCHARFLGTWEYRQAAGDGFDAEGEILELTCADGAVRGLYFGLEREGEHGLFYTLAEMTNVSVTKDGVLVFTVPERDLFSQRPTNLDEAREKKVPWAGLTRDELHMRGRLDGERLVVGCRATANACPDSVMVFRKGRWR